MMNGRALHRRLEKLEAVLNVLSADDKWAIVYERALQLMSHQDLELLEELASLENAGSAVDQDPESAAVMARFDDAFWTAMDAANVRFTVPEMEQLLAGA